MIYWDTSALLKLYVLEADSSGYIQCLSDQAEEPVISALQEIELVYALLGKERRGEIAEESASKQIRLFRDHLEAGNFMKLPWGDDLVAASNQTALNCFSAEKPIAIRSLDGIHLSAAILSGCKGLVTADIRMQEAAQYLGIPLAGPNESK